MVRRRLLIVVALVCALSACQSFGPPANFERTELYFGLSKPDGRMVTAEQWQAFVNDEITPRFPAGLSVVDAAGQWRKPDGAIAHEPSKVLLLIHPADTASETAIEVIRTRYRERFQQASVLKVTVPAHAEF